MSEFLRAKDTISGQEGRAYAIVDGQRETLFYLKSLEATIEKEKAEVRTLGRRGVQHKATGWTGSGSMTIYYVTSFFRSMMLNYVKNGVDTYFDIVTINEDPTSSIGSQSVTLKGCNLDSVMIASLDTESDALEEDFDFTFEDIEMETKFNPIGGNN